MAPTHDPRRPSTRVGSPDSSRARVNKPGHGASAGAHINQGQKPRVAVPRRIRSGFVARSSFQPVKSPSTDATTSLLQLRDNFTVLSPLIFDKVPGKFATGPKLPALNELDEYQNLSNCLPKPKRSSLNYHSDTEPQKKRDVFEEHSASLAITNDVFEKLFKDNPNFDLSECLVMEDCENISGKVTQDSDVVANTPVEKEVRHKQLSIKRTAKSIVQGEPAFDESEVEAIEDTPCYVYDRKERVLRKNIKKADTIISEKIVSLDETAIDALFSQHENQNNTENVINPTFAKKINETSAEGSDDDSILVGDHFMEKELSVNNNLEIGKSNVLVESTNTSSPLNSMKATLTRKKRKLYSPKDDANKEISTPKTRVEHRQSNTNKTPIATCYRHLENARKSHGRITKKSRAGTQTKKRTKSLYGMHSDGEDPTFQIRKCLSLSNITSITPMISRRDRPVTPVKYIYEHYCTMNSSSEDDDFEHNRTIKPNTNQSPEVIETEKTRENHLNSSKKANLLQKFKEPVSDVLSERSIAAGGRSAIADHNDLNVELLDENFQHRHMHNEGMSESMAEFQTNKPTASQTSGVIPITRIFTPKIVLERISSDEIDKYTNQMPKKYNTRRTPHSTETKIPANVIEKKTKSKLSPVKFNVDIDPASVGWRDVNSSIASVQDWLKRNATPDSPSAAASKEMFSQMMETLQTTLAEIHQATGERLSAAFSKYQEEINCLKEQVEKNTLEIMQRVNIWVQEKLEELKKNQMERTCEVIRADAEKSADGEVTPGGHSTPPQLLRQISTRFGKR